MSEENPQAERLRALYQLSTQLGSTLELDLLLNEAIDAIIQLTNAERGFLVLYEEGSRELRAEVARNLAQKTISAYALQISRSVIERSVANNEPILTLNAQEDIRFAKNSSVHNYQLRSIMCAPLQTRGRTIGAVYVDNQLTTGAFKQSDLDLLVMFATQVALGLDNARLFEESQQYAQQLEREVMNHKQTGTELKEAQARLIRQEKLAAIGQFAGSVAHELRNPLGVITNGLYFLKMQLNNANETVVEYLDLVATRTAEMEAIVAGLLDFARTQKSTPIAIAPFELITEALLRSPAPPHITVTTTIDKTYPQLYVDRLQMLQVLQNLLTNAYQAITGVGHITIAATQRDEDLMLTVADTGLGIAPDKLELIFEPLYSSKAKGVGLGLAIVRQLLEENNGRITVTSQQGVGTTFTLTLPTAS